MKTEGLKILSAEVKNFKNISQKVVKFDGRSAMIIGKNGSGKSSLIQALTCAINSNMIPSKAIKEGEERASVLVKVGGVLGGEYQEYNIDMFFSDKDQKGRLVISDQDGGKIPGGKKMVESIVGNVGFDILEFIDLGLTKGTNKVSLPGVKKQIEILKEFLPSKIQKELMDLDAEGKQVYEDRSWVNKDIKNNEAKLADSEMDPEEIEKHSEKKDGAEVLKKINQIGEDISQYDKVVNGIEAKQKEWVDRDADIKRIKINLEELEKKNQYTRNEVTKGNQWLEKKGERPSMGALTQELEDINNHNEIVKKVEEYKAFHQAIVVSKGTSEEKTARLKQLDVDKSEIFKANPLPVKGLTFTEDEILYNGLPFNENQHPSSTIIGVGLKIAMGMNPNLKLLIIKDGALLDEKTLNYILLLVEKKGYQVFVEMVDHKGEESLTVEFVEAEVIE